MSNNSNKCILIVDDEPEICEILAHIVEPLTTNVLKAANGAEALELVKLNEVHAVISDICMPVMDGLQLMRETRRAGFEIPFVFVTAYSDKDKLTEALRLGAVDFIEKPFTSEVILAVMEKVLELSSALKDLEKELSSAILQSNLGSAELDRIKNLKRAVLAMKLECDVYVKRKKK